jgi:hypothetical protein
MMGPPLPPEDKEFWKAQAEYHSELLRSGRSTDSLAGFILELIWGLARLILAVLTCLSRLPIAWWRTRRRKRS